MNFDEWLRDELNTRGMGVRELARASGLGSGTVSRILTGSRKPGPEFCQAIARALHLPEEEVLQRAGILTRPSPQIELFRQLSPAQQDAILAEMRALVAANARRAAQAADETNSEWSNNLVPNPS